MLDRVPDSDASNVDLLIRSQEDLESILITCHADLRWIIQNADKDFKSQPARRNLVRSLIVTLEVISNGMLEFSRRTCVVSNVVPETPRKRQGINQIKENVRAAHKNFETCDFPWKPSFSSNLWAEMRKCYKKRDSLMHPKSSACLEVSDKEMLQTQSAAKWLAEFTVALKRDVLQEN